MSTERDQNSDMQSDPESTEAEETETEATEVVDVAVETAETDVIGTADIADAATEVVATAVVENEAAETEQAETGQAETEQAGTEQVGTDAAAFAVTQARKIDAPAPKRARKSAGEKGTEEQVAEKSGSAPARRWLAPALWAVAAAVIITLGGLSLFFWLEHRESQQIFDERPTVLAAAQEGTTAVLTYRAATVDADVAANQQFVTGAFAEEYETLIATTILPNATERGTSSAARVFGSSLISADAESAQTLVFVAQELTSADNPEAQTTVTAMRVGLAKEGDRWLIDAMKPL